MDQRAWYDPAPDPPRPKSEWDNGRQQRQHPGGGRASTTCGNDDFTPAELEWMQALRSRKLRLQAPLILTSDLLETLAELGYTREPALTPCDIETALKREKIRLRKRFLACSEVLAMLLKDFGYRKAPAAH